MLLWLLLWVPGASWARQVTVQLNWKHQFEFAAFYAALERGYYRDAGLEVVLREGGPGIDAVTEAVEGRADFGVGTSALVVERHHGKPVVALASLMQHSPIALLALRRNGVHSVHDLAGRPVAVDPHSRDEIDAYMRASGIPAEQIRFVDQTDWTLASLEAGREAAKVVYVSNEPYFVRGREHEFVLLRPQSAGVDLFGNMLFTTEAMIARRAGMVRAFRDATLKGLVHALEQPEAIAELILARYNTQGKTREHLLFEAVKLRELTRTDIVEPGYMSPGRWQHVARVYAGQGKLPPDFDLSGLVFDDRPSELPPWLLYALGAAAVALVGSVLLMAKFRRLNLALEGRVEARTAELVKARDEARQLARAKSEFLANMSHEIRTPLNAVLGFAGIGERDSIEPRSRERFRRILRAGDHLLGVIDDVLDFSRLEAGKLDVDRSPLELRRLLADAAELVAEAAQRKGLALEVTVDAGVPGWVLGDARRLKQVLANLLSNAVKFTASGSVRLQAARVPDGVRLEVADTGIGMAPDQVSRLFRPFEQADSSTTRRFGGSGLGLAISRRLLELMDGHIEVESTPAVGSRFVVTLPLPAAQPAPAAAGPAPGARRLEGVRVLAADDLEVNRLLLQELLGHEGARVVFAVNGRDAVDRVAEAGPGGFDVVLMDVQMPVMDGCEAASRLRELAPALAVIAVTAHALPEQRQRCVEAGMVRHLCKPIDAEALVNAIRQAVSAQPGPVGGCAGRVGQAVAAGDDRGGLPAAAGAASAQGLDRGALLALMNGDEGGVERLLAATGRYLADKPTELRRLARDRDLPALAALAHDLKGAMGNLKATGLGRLAARTEQAARTGGAESAALALELADAADVLRGTLESSRPPDPKAAGPVS